MKTGICKFCLQEKPLVRSHLASRALYDLCRAPDSEPVMVSQEVVMATSRQWQYPLLCQECDGSFSEKGEAWVLPLLATIEGAFPFYDILKKVPPHVNEDDVKGYSATRNPEIDVEKLAHFAMGVFWKASIHSWRGGTNEPQIELGPYREQIRTFLRGETTFPQRVALMVVVQRPPVTQISFNLPHQGPVTEYHNFTFYVPGIMFALAVGKRIASVKPFCFYSDSSHAIVLADVSDDIKGIFRAISAKAHKASKLVKYMKNRQGSR